MLAAGTSSGAVSIWDTKTQTLKYKFEALKNSVWVLRFSPDSHRLLVGGGNIGEGIGIGAESGELSLWDMTTGHLIKQLEGHKQIVLSLAFSADNTLAVSSGFDCNLFVWDANTGAQLHAIVPQKIAGSIVGGTPSGVMFSADQTQIYVVPLFGKPVLVKYDRNSLTLIDSLQLSVPDACGRILMHPDGKRFLCAVGSSGLLYMLDVNTAVPLKQYPGIEKTLDNLSFNADAT